MLNKAVIFDIDGTLANTKHRNHFLETDIKNWPAFFKTSIYDTTNINIVNILNSYIKDGYKIILMTGRTIKYKDITVEWLSKYNITYDMLFMRDNKNFENVTSLKLKWYDHLKFILNIESIYEDNIDTISEFNKLNINTFYIKNGLVTN